MSGGPYGTRHPDDEGEIQESTAPGAPADRRQLGPYRLIGELGRGAMGVVYEAEHSQLGRRVALKVLPEELSASADCYARFQREMQAIGRLEHPNIVLATDAGQIDGICFIAMQLIRGVDLSQVLADHGTLTVGQACEAARQVALGLDEIDSHGIIHRDIKPSNLLLAANGEVKILDLGIASLRQGSSSGGKLTMTGGILGTPDYIAPEQINNIGPIDVRADIYSLGCTLYHLLSGRAPFSGPQYNSLPAKLMGHAEHNPEPLEATTADIPGEVIDVVGRMMARNRDERIARPMDVVRALEPFCNSEALDAIAKAYGTSDRLRSKGPVSDWAETAPLPGGSASTNKSSRPIPVIVAAMGLVLVIGGYAAWSAMSSGDDQARSDMSEATVPQSAADISDQPQQQQQRETSRAPAPSAPAIKENSLPVSETEIAENTRTIVEETKKLNEKASEVAESSQAVADNTERIALTLEQVQAQFSEIVDEVRADPQTPGEWYANALIHARSGNQLQARRAYLEFFKFGLNVIDPWLNFAKLLRLQEGVAGARETFAAIPGGASLPARRLVEISLQPEDRRRELLQELLRKHPEFGPAHLALAETYEGDVTYDARLTLLDQMAKKTAINDYLSAHADGRVLKYYLDQSMAGEQLDKAKTLQENFAEVTQQSVDNPVGLNWYHELGNHEFWLDFRFAEEARSPEYRFGKDNEFTAFELPDIRTPAAFRSLLPIGQDGLTTDDFDGTLVVSTRLEVPDSTPKSTLEVRYKDRSGVPRGPYEFAFSPGEMMRKQALQNLHGKNLPDDWVKLRHGQDQEEVEFPNFGEWYDITDVSFAGLLLADWRAVKSIRYGLDVDTPNRDFPVPTADFDSETQPQYRLKVRGHVSHAVLQVTFIDGTTTEVLRVDADKD